MLDGAARKLIDPLLDRIGAPLAKAGISANAITIASLIVGLASAGFIIFGHMYIGLFLLLLSRVGDGLDGVVARYSKPTAYGGYLDIVLDFVFYGAIPLAFIIHDPVQNGLAGAVLLFSFQVNCASFLGYAALAEKKKLSTDVRGSKSIYFTTGIAEATETFATFTLFCLFPQWFTIIAYIFATICFYTALSRIVLAWQVFGQSDGVNT